MEESGRTPSQTSDALFIVLMLASLLLVFASVLLVEVLSVNYGIGLGAYLQGNLTQTNVSPTLVPTVLGASSLRTSILEMYIVTGIAVAMFLIAFILYSIKAGARQSSEGRRYTLLHLILSLIFSGLFAMEFYTFNIGINPLYLFAIGAAMVACVCIDGYTEYMLHFQVQVRGVRTKKELNINPSTPFSNLVALRSEIFSNLTGRVGVVDKHFNSEALENLYRLTSGTTGGITGLDVMTSKEMLDSSFFKDYTDLKSEMKNRGVELSVMLMDDADAIAQHERFIFDGASAYKIPPMNIIHKKSEHVIRIKTSDARKRFGELKKKAITIENYAVKQARKPDEA